MARPKSIDDASEDAPAEITIIEPPAPPIVSPPAPIPAGHVRVRVLKNGHGKISDGAFQGQFGFRTGRYSRGDEFSCPKDTADALELRGYVETL